MLQRPLLRWGQDQLKTTRGGRNAIQLTHPGSGQDKHTVVPSQLQKESKAKWQSSEPWKQHQKEEVRLDLERAKKKEQEKNTHLQRREQRCGQQEEKGKGE